MPPCTGCRYAPPEPMILVCPSPVSGGLENPLGVNQFPSQPRLLGPRKGEIPMNSLGESCVVLGARSAPGENPGCGVPNAAEMPNISFWLT